MSRFKVHIVPVLSDNYVYILEGPAGEAAIVDPGEAAAVESYIAQHDLKPEVVLLTHHHGDHIGGVGPLAEKYDVRIYAPAAEKDKILAHAPRIDRTLKHQDVFELFGVNVDVIQTPGHTAGHICYYLPTEHILLAGDTLFSIGCGRVFEGTMEEMHTSLQYLKSLPDEARIYCGHEYTLANLEFALTLHPNDPELKAKQQAVEALRKQGQPSLPSKLGEEKKLNPFLQAGTAEEFANVRRKKDNF